MAGCDTSFTTSNYLVTTTPNREYGIATGALECPPEDMLDRKKRRVRVLRSIDSLRTLELCTRAGLKDYEILAVVSPPPPFRRVSSRAIRKPAPRARLCFLSGAGCNRGGGGGGGGGIGQSAGALHRPHVPGQPPRPPASPEAAPVFKLLRRSVPATLVSLPADCPPPRSHPRFTT